MSGARLRSIPGTRSGDMERHTGAEREPTALDSLIADLLAERFRGPVRRAAPHQRRPIQRGHEDTDLDRARRRRLLCEALDGHAQAERGAA